MLAGEGFVDEENTVAVLRQTVAHLEGQVKVYQEMLHNALMGTRAKDEPIEDMRPFLATLTPKQHATVQMLLRGASNREIAQRMGWKEETAKGSVRNIGLRLGLSSKQGRIRRETIDARLRYTIEHMRPDEYLAMAKIPCDWDKSWSEKDKLVHPFLYERRSAAA